MTHNPNEFNHSTVFGSNLNYNLEELLKREEEELKQQLGTFPQQQQQQPHHLNPLQHQQQQDKFNRRIDMY